MGREYHPGSDRSRWHAAIFQRKFSEDAADDRGVRFIDLAFAPNRLALTVGPLHHLLAAAEPTARLTLLHPPTQASMGLGGEASCL